MAHNMIEVRGLTKRYGPVLAVEALSFGLRPGTVTGFLGPNGSGKSTTMRMVLGLDRPDRGTAVIGGRRYRELRWPLREVGALLEAKAFHPGRSARARGEQPDSGGPRRRGPGHRGPDGRRGPAGRHVLPRNGPAARHRIGAAWRSQGAAAR